MEQNELECINGQSDLEYLEEMALSSDFTHTSEIEDRVVYLKELLQELAQYRALAEQIGCPLEVVFRALKDGIYHNYTDYNYKTKLDKWFIFEMENKIAYRKGEVQIVHRFVRIIDEKQNHFESDNREICPINEMSNSHLVDIDTYDFIKWSDYKKTWWLKQDKSE